MEEVDADELGDVASRRPSGDGGGGAGLGDATGFDDDETVGEDDRVDGVVGDQQPGAGEGGEVSAELGPDTEAGRGVERGERFVEEQQAGVGGEGAGEGDPLGLSS